MIDSLPPELICTILSYLPVETLPSCFLVSHLFGEFSTYEPLWRDIYDSTYASESECLPDDPPRLFRERVRLILDFLRRIDVHLSEDPVRLTGKFVTVGASGSGKTSLIRRYFDDQFDDVYASTIGAAFQQKLISEQDLASDRPLMAQVWDTAGQERYRALSPMYYRGSAGYILVFDITDRDWSFRQVRSHLAEIIRTFSSPSRRLMILIGNKIDLEHNREVSRREIDELLEEFQPHVARYFETSAKTGEGVKEAFDWVFERAAVCYVARGGSVEESRIVVDDRARVEQPAGGFAAWLNSWCSIL